VTAGSPTQSPQAREGGEAAVAQAGLQAHCAARAGPAPGQGPRDFGVYVHFPYCLSKCHYCDFASRAEAVIPQRRYTDAILRELRAQAPLFQGAGRRAVSIYFGGGTPSLWEPALFAEVLREAKGLFGVPDAAEITLEANPGTTDEARFTAFRAAGANRISIGVQSFASRQLVALGRTHSGGDAERAYLTARKAGFANVTLDLIHGAQAQDVAGARSDALHAAALGPEHLSAYALTLTGLAEDVPLAKAVRRGDVEVPGDELVAEMGEAVREALAGSGYARYEISNYAKSGFEAVHNSLYWRGLEYAAVGCGACGFLRWREGAAGAASSGGPAVGRRWQNDRSPERYLERVEQTGLGEASGELLSAAEHLRERLFTGLRLAAGLDLEALEADLGLPVRERFAEELSRLVREGLAVQEGARLRLTDRGLDLHSEVAVRFF
jgi:putative oxygen-independent coproporphyrinogen III oxidase